MVHILLTILKVLGILIAFLLGMLILFFLIVLFGPIGYEAEGKKEEELDMKARITWLFFVVRGDVSYSREKLIWFLRIFGITAASNEETFLKKKEEKKRRRLEREKKKKDSIRDSVTTEAPEKDVIKETESFEEAKTGESEKRELKTEGQKKDNARKATPKKKAKAKPADLIKKLSDSLKKTVEKIKQIPAKIKQLIQKIRELLETGNRYRDFFFAEENKKVFAYLFAKLKKMAVHILPRKIRGSLEFGLDDPYVMGQILAVLGILLPFYEDKLEIRPDFEEKKLNGKFYLKGRIIPGYLLFQCLMILLKKEVRRLVRDGRKLIGGNV